MFFGRGDARSEISVKFSISASKSDLDISVILIVPPLNFKILK